MSQRRWYHSIPIKSTNQKEGRAIGPIARLPASAKPAIPPRPSLLICMLPREQNEYVRSSHLSWAASTYIFVHVTNDGDAHMQLGEKRVDVLLNLLRRDSLNPCAKQAEYELNQ